MAARSNTPHWEAPKFSFGSQNKGQEWKSFYIKTVGFLKAMDIDIYVADDSKKARNS